MSLFCGGIQQQFCSTPPRAREPYSHTFWDGSLHHTYAFAGMHACVAAMHMHYVLGTGLRADMHHFAHGMALVLAWSIERSGGMV